MLGEGERVVRFAEGSGIGVIYIKGGQVKMRGLRPDEIADLNVKSRQDVSQTQDISYPSVNRRRVP